MSGIFLLRSSDGQEFRVERDVIALSKTLNTMIQDLGLDEVTATPIPLPNVDAQTLKKVLRWCCHHKNKVIRRKEDRPLIGCIVPEWDRRFLAIGNKALLKVVMAADYLNIQKLFDYACQTVTDNLTDKTPEQIRKDFRIPSNFTEEEIAEIKSESSWYQQRYA